MRHMAVSLTPRGPHRAPVSYPFMSPTMLPLEPLPYAGSGITSMGLEREEEAQTRQTPVSCQLRRTLWPGALGGRGRTGQQGRLTPHRHGAFHRSPSCAGVTTAEQSL